MSMTATSAAPDLTADFRCGYLNGPGESEQD